MSIQMVQRLFQMQLNGSLQTIRLQDHYQQWADNSFRDLLAPLSLPAENSHFPSELSQSLPSSAPSSLMDHPRRRAVKPPSNFPLSTPSPVPSLVEPLFKFHLLRLLSNSAGESTEQQNSSQESLLEIQMRDIHLMANQETLLALLKFTHANVLQPWKRANSSTCPPSTASSSTATVESNTAPLRIVANLGCFKFTLNHCGQHLAEGYLDRCRFEVFPEPQGTRLEGNIGHLKILDLASSHVPDGASNSNSGVAFKEVIVIQSSTNALNFTFKWNRTSGKDTGTPDKSLTVSATGAKVLLVHQFFSRLIGYAAELRYMIAPKTTPTTPLTVQAPANDSSFRFVPLQQVAQ